MIVSGNGALDQDLTISLLVEQKRLQMEQVFSTLSRRRHGFESRMCLKYLQNRMRVVLSGGETRAVSGSSGNQVWNGACFCSPYTRSASSFVQDLTMH